MSSSEHEPLPYHVFLYHVEKVLGQHADEVFFTRIRNAAALEELGVNFFGIQTGFSVTSTRANRAPLLVGLTKEEIDLQTEFVAVRPIQVVDLPDQPTLVNPVGNLLVSRYNLHWLTSGRDINTRVVGKQWPNDRFFIALKDATPAAQHTPDTIAAKLEQFLRIYRRDDH